MCPPSLFGKAPKAAPTKSSAQIAKEAEDMRRNLSVSTKGIEANYNSGFQSGANNTPDAMGVPLQRITLGA